MLEEILNEESFIQEEDMKDGAYIGFSIPTLQ